MKNLYILFIPIVITLASFFIVSLIHSFTAKISYTKLLHSYWIELTTSLKDLIKLIFRKTNKSNPLESITDQLIDQLTKLSSVDKENIASVIKLLEKRNTVTIFYTLTPIDGALSIQGRVEYAGKKKPATNISLSYKPIDHTDKNSKRYWHTNKSEFKSLKQ